MAIRAATSIATAALIALSACQPMGAAPDPGNYPALPADSVRVTSAGQLDGTWSVEGAEPGAQLRIADNRITFVTGCTGGQWSYRVSRGTLSTTVDPIIACRRAYSPEEQRVYDLIDDARSAYVRDGRGIVIRSESDQLHFPAAPR